MPIGSRRTVKALPVELAPHIDIPSSKDGMKRTFKLLATLAALILSIIRPAWAGIVGLSGDIALIPAPPSTLLEQFASESVIRGFFERQGVQLASDLAIDGASPGTYESSQGGLLPAGLAVSSYLFHADTLANDPFGTHFRATVVFDTEIVGVLFNRDTLNASDAVLGTASTIYDASDSAYRELEIGSAARCGTQTYDCVTISPDRRTIALDFSTGAFIDEVRVVIANRIPEPNTGWLAVLALMIVAGGRPHHCRV